MGIAYAQYSSTPTPSYADSPHAGCYSGWDQNQIGGLASESKPNSAATPSVDGESSPKPEINPMLAKFDRLMEDLITGQMQRSKFERWEMEILLDIAVCGPSVTPRALNAYCKAVHKQMATGATHPIRLSEFLATRPSAVQEGR